MFGILQRSRIERSFSLCEVSRVFEGEAAPTLDNITTTNTPLKNGDLLRVFRSITQAETFLECDIEWEIEREQEYPKGVDRKLWTKLFQLRLPARLTQSNGDVIDGHLEAVMEQGMGGPMWSLYDFEDNGYHSLHPLKQGDHITVFSKVLAGLVEWEGPIEKQERADGSVQFPLRGALNGWSERRLPVEIVTAKP